MLVDGTLPNPLPISSNPELRRASAGKEIFAPAQEPNWRKRTRGEVLQSFLRNRLDQNLRRSAPQIIKHDIAGFRGNRVAIDRDQRVGTEIFDPFNVRPAATTRFAPRRFAICTASRPATPVRSRIRTLSPRTSCARNLSAAHDDMPGFAIPAAVTSSRPSGNGNVKPATLRSAKEPTGLARRRSRREFHPANGRRHRCQE